MRKQAREWARGVYKSYLKPGRRYSDEDFRNWLGWVEQVEVELHPGGRATLANASEIREVEVEVRWEPLYEGSSMIAVRSFQVSALPGGTLPPYEFSFSHYAAALGLALMFPETKEQDAAQAPRPSPGRLPPIDFYRALVGEYDRLLREGHPSPVNELSRRHRTKPGTVKSWLSRGRKYLREAKG